MPRAIRTTPAAGAYSPIRRRNAAHCRQGFAAPVHCLSAARRALARGRARQGTPGAAVRGWAKGCGLDEGLLRAGVAGTSAGEHVEDMHACQGMPPSPTASHSSAPAQTWLRAAASVRLLRTFRAEG